MEQPRADQECREDPGVLPEEEHQDFSQGGSKKPSFALEHENEKNARCNLERAADMALRTWLELNGFALRAFTLHRSPEFSAPGCHQEGV